MYPRLRGGALALAVTLLAAACGSSTTTTSATSATSAPTSTTSATMSGAMSGSSTPMDPSMSMDSAGSGAMDEMGGMDMGDTSSDTHGLTLSVVDSPLAANQSADLSFKVLNSDGTALTEFQEEQTKLLHLILVRSDLSEYQHVHPTMSNDGTWTVPVTFQQGGSYRMVADFVPVLEGTAASRTSITTDLTVSGKGTDRELPKASTTATVDGFTVQMTGELTSSNESDLTFTVVDNAGKPVQLETYLGAYGHLVAFAKSDLAYTHIHPSSADQNNGTVTFLGQVNAPGPHRLFLQFAADGKVHTAEFTLDAA